MDPAKPKDTKTYNFTYRRTVLVRYLLTKAEEGDWHAVSDAANDLRVLEAEERVRDELSKREA